MRTIAFPTAHAALKMTALAGVTLSSLPARAQNPNGPLYQGAQPQLVQGVQDGIANAQPKIRHVYLAAPDVLTFVVDAQQMWGGPIQPYVAQPGDDIRRTGPQPYGKQGHEFFWNRQIFRGGQLIGDLVGPKEDHYTPVFKLEGQPLNVEWAANAANYSLSSRDDAAFAQPQKPLQVNRKTNPQMWEWTDKIKAEGTDRHEIYLKWPRALTPGKRYTLNFGAASPFAAPVSFLFDDTQLRTEAIEVNQAGYHPRQTEKVARLFGWMGDGGGIDYSAFKVFQGLSRSFNSWTTGAAKSPFAARLPCLRRAMRRAKWRPNTKPTPTTTCPLRFTTWIFQVSARRELTAWWCRGWALRFRFASMNGCGKTPPKSRPRAFSISAAASTSGRLSATTTRQPSCAPARRVSRFIKPIRRFTSTKSCFPKAAVARCSNAFRPRSWKTNSSRTRGAAGTMPPIMTATFCRKTICARCTRCSMYGKRIRPISSVSTSICPNPGTRSPIFWTRVCGAWICFCASNSPTARCQARSNPSSIRASRVF